jgi:hypothetical protein
MAWTKLRLHAYIQGRAMAGAYMRMGQLFQQLGQSEKAYTQYHMSHDIILALAARDPKSDKAQARQSNTGSHPPGS